MYQTTQQLNPIDRLFLRMASFYGKHWLDMWADVPIDSVKSEWQSRLTCMSSKVVFKAVDYCADNLKFPPTLPEFVQLCKANTPHEITKALSRHFTEAEIELNQERIKKASSDLAKTPITDMKQWARDLISGNKISNNPDLAIRMAKEALAA